MIVTVTGANGFIGHHLVRDQLARGREVRAVDMALSRLEDLRHNPAVELIQADIRDADRMREAVTSSDVVFHLASAHLAVTLSDADYWQINCVGSKGLVELCHDAGVKRFIHCSSVGVYGEIHDPPANEESDHDPDLLYERTKLAGEQAVRQYGQETGYPIVVVQPVWVYGPGCPRTEKLFRMLKKQRFVFVGNGQALRHCIYITDLLEAFNLCAQHPNAPGNVFIIGDHGAVTVRGLIDQMASIAGVPAPRISLPLWLMKPAGVVLERVFTLFGKEPPFSSRSLKFFTNNTSFSIERAKKELGFNPKVTLTEGLRLSYNTIIGSRNPQVRGVA